MAQTGRCSGCGEEMKLDDGVLVEHSVPRQSADPQRWTKICMGSYQPPLPGTTKGKPSRPTYYSPAGDYSTDSSQAAKFSRHAACFGCGRSFLRAELTPGKNKQGPRCLKCLGAGNDGSGTKPGLDKPVRPAPIIQGAAKFGSPTEYAASWQRLTFAEKKALLNEVGLSPSLAVQSFVNIARDVDNSILRKLIRKLS